jgi:hypothetical protein
MGEALKELAERLAALPSICQRGASRKGFCEGLMGRRGEAGYF